MKISKLISGCAMGKRGWWKRACVVSLVCVAAATIAPSAQLSTLVNFDGTNGANPYQESLVQGLDGNLYGTTLYGGKSNYGTVFKMTPSGTLMTLRSFDGTDGAYPRAGLALGTDGNFYGTTEYGGAYGLGTVFKITPNGVLTVLHSFAGNDGDYVYRPLVQGTDGKFYGTTNQGGVYNYGTVFNITPGGAFTLLYAFDGTDGAYPYGLVQGTDGNFYGTTYGGGAKGIGTVFKITSSGMLSTLHSFDGTDGTYPSAPVVQGTDGKFYGTTQYGGASNYGTVFRITSTGVLSTVHSFDYYTDGGYPVAPVVQGTDGNFYGTAEEGGAGSLGTIFKVTPGGTLTALHNFSGTDGSYPYGGLAQYTGGAFYGTTYQGGTSNDGTVFSLSVGLGPFVRTLPTSGKVGTAVKILGTNLTGATSVSFAGTAATFKVVSSSEITTTVPAGATTGKVEVKTPSRTLSSNVAFRVTPSISSFSPTSGPVDTSVTITGESLTGATSVTFGGVKATSFKVDSDTEITATVPTGAKTGKIGVTTPGGTATSTGTFTVD